MATGPIGADLRLEKRGEDGFSLVELLVAISLFGLVLTAVAGAFISSVRSIGDQRLRTAATRVASDRIETLRSLSYDRLGAEVGSRTTRTPDGGAFTVDTALATIDAATGAPAGSGAVQQVTVTVRWTSRGAARNVSYSTAIAAKSGTAPVQQAIGTVIMVPRPVTTDSSGRPLEDIDVTVPLVGFPVNTLVQVSWTNADGTAGGKTLTSTTAVNWRGTIAKAQLLVALNADGRGQVQFTVSAGSLTTLYGLPAQRVEKSPPAITTAAIDRNPVTVASPATGRTCADRNQCQNTVAVTFTVTVNGLDPNQDSVVVQFQLYDRTSLGLPLSPVSGTTGQWRLVVGQRTTKFLAGTARTFGFTAVRSADGAAATATVLRDVAAT